MAIQDIAASPNQVLATLIASITIAIITAFQIIALLQNNNPKAAPIKTSPSLIVIVQVIYGLLVFVGFTYWAFNLFAAGLLPWAGLSWLTALVGLMMPYWVWSKATVPLAHNQTHAPDAIDEVNESDLPPALAALADLSKTVSEAEYVFSEPAQPETTHTRLETELNKPVQEASPTLAVPPVSEHGLAADTSRLEPLCNRPSDSILKRHYDQLVSADNAKFNSFISIVEPVSTEQASDALVATNQSIQSQPATPVSTLQPPQDSILRRHYDQLVSSENAILNASIDEDKPVSTEKASTAPTICPKPGQTKPATLASKPTLPQDSILRRHTLALLQTEIEAGLPEYPSDSVLKRHHAQRLACELEKLKAL